MNKFWLWTSLFVTTTSTSPRMTVAFLSDISHCRTFLALRTLWPVTGHVCMPQHGSNIH